MARPLIGRTVRRLRSERGLTQQALATRLGISASYLNLIEHDQRAVTLDARDVTAMPERAFVPDLAQSAEEIGKLFRFEILSDDRRIDEIGKDDGKASSLTHNSNGRLCALNGHV